MNEDSSQLNSPNRPNRADSPCPPIGYQPIDDHHALSGRDLRYVLTRYIQQGHSTVAALARQLAADGYTVWGRASKSDLRRPQVGGSQRSGAPAAARCVHDRHNPSHHLPSHRHACPSSFLLAPRCRYTAERICVRRSQLHPPIRPPLAKMGHVGRLTLPDPHHQRQMPNRGDHTCVVATAGDSELCGTLSVHQL
jgi:hypothetical protein